MRITPDSGDANQRVLPFSICWVSLRKYDVKFPDKIRPVLVSPDLGRHRVHPAFGALEAMRPMARGQGDRPVTFSSRHSVAEILRNVCRQDQPAWRVT